MLMRRTRSKVRKRIHMIMPLSVLTLIPFAHRHKMAFHLGWNPSHTFDVKEDAAPVAAVAADPVVRVLA